jgi:hypothetical protein
MNKKYLFPVLVVLLSVTLISWGVIGHRAIAKIAGNHLSPEARAAVQDLLGNETLSEVSTWADEIRSQPQYKNTGPWHYLNLPLGLSYPEFVKQVEGMTQDNVYNALRKCEAEIVNPQASREQKVFDLKFIVHLVGDLHQPMHISRAEDQGGNKIQVFYDGKGANLHSVWDSRLIEHQGLNEEELAQKYDHISPAQIKEWQGDPLVKWIWESYQASSKLYAEIDQLSNHTLDDAYYQAHMPIIEDRIQRAGIRLAGVLNEVFKNGVKFGPGVSPAALSAAGAPSSAGLAAPAVTSASAATSFAADPAKPIAIGDVSAHMGETVTVCSKVFGFKILDNSGMTLVNLGAAYPDQLLTVVLKGDPAGYHVDRLDNTTLCATGKLIEYKGKPEIVVTDPKMIGQ